VSRIFWYCTTKTSHFPSQYKLSKNNFTTLTVLFYMLYPSILEFL
jgi:hypothetical protein